MNNGMYQQKGNYVLCLGTSVNIKKYTKKKEH